MNPYPKTNFITVVKSLGLKRMPWNKCAQGFKESNYQCFYDDKKNIWIEIYLTDRPVYCLVQSSKTGHWGKFFYDANELKTFLQ